MYALPGYDTTKYLIKQENDPAKKDKAYFFNNVNAIYSEYLRGMSAIGYAGTTRIDILRSFAEGRQAQRKQPVTKDSSYSSLLDQNGNRVKREYDEADGYTYQPEHPVWEIMSPANKIVDALFGTLSKIDYDISADPMDYATRMEVEDEKLRRWVLAQNALKIAAVSKMAGVDYPMPEFLPESLQDLDQYEEEFLPAHVRYLEQIIKHLFDVSGWSPNTKLLFLRDLIATNMACIQNVYDPEDGKVKPVYRDIRYADIQKSIHMDCHDSERAWHFEVMSITQLRQHFPDKPEKWFMDLAGNFCNQYDNPPKDSFSSYTIQDPYGKWLYDPFKVAVLCCEWIDIDSTKEVIGEKNGRRIVKEVPLDKRVANDKVIRFRDERTRFGAKWVIGTDEVFDYGKCYDVTYPTKNDTELTYKWIVLPGKSKIEQLIPILQNFQDLWDKYRDLLRNAQGKIQFLDVDMLSSVQGKNDNPEVAAKKAFRRFLATNKLMFRRINAQGLPNQNHPIAELDGGMGSLFVEIQAAFKTNIEMVEYITGLNPLSLGQSADPNAPVTTSQMAMNATSNVIRPLAEGYLRMKQAIAENLSRWVVVSMRGNEYSRKAYEQVIGKYGVQCIIAANKGEAEYGIRLTPHPTDLEKQWMLQNLQLATTPAQGGEREISTADANLIFNMINSGSPIKTVQFFFEKARRKQRATIMAEKEQLMKQQSQLNQQDSQMGGQMRLAEGQQNHAMNMELQDKKNEGANKVTETQELLRAQKEKDVQNLKNQGSIQTELVKPRPEKVKAE